MNPGPFPARLRTLACLAVLVLTYTVPAADPGQRPVNHGDYDGWRNINDTQLSRDGKYLAYALVPEDGDGELVVRHASTGKDRAVLDEPFDAFVQRQTEYKKWKVIGVALARPLEARARVSHIKTAAR